jgi:acyl carrier protein
MDSSTVSAELASIFREDLQIDLSRFTADSHLIDEVGLDSVAFAVGMVAIEEKLGVVLSEEELLNCNTLGDLDTAIRNLGAAVPATAVNGAAGPATSVNGAAGPATSVNGAAGPATSVEAQG